MEVLLVTAALFGGVTALAARARGRDPFAWFFVGAFFQVFGLVAVIVMENLKFTSTDNQPRPLAWRHEDGAE